jgi:hypothetical protein
MRDVPPIPRLDGSTRPNFADASCYWAQFVATGADEAVGDALKAQWGGDYV